MNYLGFAVNHWGYAVNYWGPRHELKNVL